MSFSNVLCFALKSTWNMSSQSSSRIKVWFKIFDAIIFANINVLMNIVAKGNLVGISIIDG